MVFCPVLCSNCGHEDVQWVLETYYVHYDNYGHIDELVFLLMMYLKGALRQSPCEIPKVVAKVRRFVLLFFTCSVTSFRRILMMLNSSGSRITDKSLYKCSLLMVSNAFVISSSKM